MKDYERIDYLVKVLAGNNARMFAQKTGIRPDSLSRARKGANRPSSYFERILSAYPDVSRDWLYNGTGEPLLSSREKSEVLTKLDALEKEVGRLAKILDAFTKCQESTNTKV